MGKKKNKNKKDTEEHKRNNSATEITESPAKKQKFLDNYFLENKATTSQSSLNVHDLLETRIFKENNITEKDIKHYGENENSILKTILKDSTLFLVSKEHKEQLESCQSTISNEKCLQIEEKIEQKMALIDNRKSPEYGFLKLLKYISSEKVQNDKEIPIDEHGYTPISAVKLKAETQKLQFKLDIVKEFFEIENDSIKIKLINSKTKIEDDKIKVEHCKSTEPSITSKNMNEECFIKAEPMENINEDNKINEENHENVINTNPLMDNVDINLETQSEGKFIYLDDTEAISRIEKKMKNKLGKNDFLLLKVIKFVLSPKFRDECSLEIDKNGYISVSSLQEFVNKRDKKWNLELVKTVLLIEDGKVRIAINSETTKCDNQESRYCDNRNIDKNFNNKLSCDNSDARDNNKQQEDKLSVEENEIKLCIEKILSKQFRRNNDIKPKKEDFYDLEIIRNIAKEENIIIKWKIHKSLLKKHFDIKDENSIKLIRMFKVSNSKNENKCKNSDKASESNSLPDDAMYGPMPPPMMNNEHIPKNEIRNYKPIDYPGKNTDEDNSRSYSRENKNRTENNSRNGSRESEHRNKDNYKNNNYRDRSRNSSKNRSDSNDSIKKQNIQKLERNNSNDRLLHLVHNFFKNELKRNIIPEWKGFVYVNDLCNYLKVKNEADFLDLLKQNSSSFYCEFEKSTLRYQVCLKSFQTTSKNDVIISKELSSILRHNAERRGLKIGADGYIPVEDILRLPKFRLTNIDDIKRIVDSNDKQRFALKDDEARGLLIRANQGHSISTITVDYEEITLESNLKNVVHGTYFESWSNIEKQGLSRMKRTHIHFAIGLPQEKDVISGMRSSSQIIISVDWEKAIKDGYKFYRSENNVILCPGNENGILPSKYFKKVYDRKSGKIFMKDGVKL